MENGKQENNNWLKLDEYKYVGLELTPSVFEKLLIELYDGKQFHRQNAIEVITDYHKKRGGVLQKSEYISVFKKACQQLKDKGITNMGYGVWRLAYQASTVAIEEKVEKKETIYADKLVGNGNQSVYLYYYDTYKKYSELKGEHCWECKIGKTETEPLSRIIGQSGTCYPEVPHVALIVYCDDSSLLEKAIHDVLKLRNKWITSAPGKEWFLTTPKEVEEIYYAIKG